MYMEVELFPVASSFIFLFSCSKEYSVLFEVEYEVVESSASFPLIIDSFIKQNIVTAFP